MVGFFLLDSITLSKIRKMTSKISKVPSGPQVLWFSFLAVPGDVSTIGARGKMATFREHFTNLDREHGLLLPQKLSLRIYQSNESSEGTAVQLY